MKPASVIILSTLLAGILTLFISCNGLSKPEGQKAVEKVAPTGTKVAALDEAIMVIFQDQQDHLWFGSKDKGVYQYNGDSLVLFTKEDGLCNNSIIGIQEDEQGHIFFDTPTGISKFDGRKFTTLNVVKQDTTINEWRLEPHDLWFRMNWEGDGPYRYDGEYLYQLTFPKTNQVDSFYTKYPNASYSPYGIYTIYQDRQGTLWFGTAALGICRYDGNSLSWLYERQLTETPAGGDFGIRSIIEDKEGYFWFCNSRYRYEILPGSTEKKGTHYINYNKEAGVSNSTNNEGEEFPYFMSVTEGKEGDLWMLTYDDGVWQSNGKKLTHYPVKDDEKNVLLFTIYKDHQDSLWLGTHNAGVFKFNGSTFEKFRP